MTTRRPHWSKYGEPEQQPLDTERLARLWLEEATLAEGEAGPAESESEDSEADWEWVTAGERLRRLVDEDRDTAWRVILRLIELADDPLLGRVGAGPLEDLLRGHGSEFIAKVERLAAVDTRFREALRSVWGWATMSEDLLVRISRAAGRTL
jgi:hypothetical protein